MVFYSLFDGFDIDSLVGVDDFTGVGWLSSGFVFLAWNRWVWVVEGVSKRFGWWVVVGSSSL